MNVFCYIYYMLYLTAGVLTRQTYAEPNTTINRKGLHTLYEVHIVILSDWT